MGHRVLDQKLMQKIAEKTGKLKLAHVNVMVSHKAAKHGISPEAALVVIAKENGIGSAIYQKRLDSTKQAEIRHALAAPAPPIRSIPTSKGETKSRPTSDGRTSLRAAIEWLIQDTELQNRCVDLLLLNSKFDRAINQATLVLEDRIRSKSQPSTSRVGENLVNFAFKDDPSNTVLRVAGGGAEDQRGFTQILRGIVPAFRNRTHHYLTDSFTREDAIRVCGFIDVLLRVVDSSTKIQ